MVDCIVLAGGLGTRLRATVPDRPKPLALINGVPFLDILLKRLQGMHKAVLAVGYRAQQIVEHYQQHPPLVPVEFSLEDSPLGTGGAVKRALAQTHSEHVLVLNGDSLLEVDLALLLHAHHERQADLTIACIAARDACRFGRLVLEPKSQRVLQFQEKSPDAAPGLINGGVYVMRRDLLSPLPLGDQFSLERDAFPMLVSKRIFGHVCDGLFIDIGTASSFKEAQTLL
jgi:D-glycero-alpha-D-manno-heptose 1-phosphate guanylyltransferase